MKDAYLKGSLQIRKLVGAAGSQPQQVLIAKLLEVAVNVSEYDIREVIVSAGAVDFNPGFAGVSNVAFVYIHSDKPLKLKVNGTTDETSTGTDFLFTGSSLGYITSLLISNPGTEDALVWMVFGG